MLLIALAFVLGTQIHRDEPTRIFLAPQQGASSYQGPASPAAPVTLIPKKKSATIALMPGQAINLPNRTFRIVEVHSQFPLRILTGKCHDDYAVEFVCNGDPGDIFITDRRVPPIFHTPEGNSVTVTVTEF